MLSLDTIPTKRILSAIMHGLNDGTVLQYYLDQSWEAPLRNDFGQIVSTFASGRMPAEETIKKTLRKLNYGYRTRYKLSSLYYFGDVIFQLAHEKEWWNSNPPSLFGSSESEAAELASIPAVVIRAMTAKEYARPYSLTTKCLHFLFPDSFAICDQQAAVSVQMWSFFAYRNRDTNWQQFSWPRLADMTGNGYIGIINFYRHLWETASEYERDEIIRGAQNISMTIGGPVSPVDIVDKILWRANGDPLLLGFQLA